MKSKPSNQATRRQFLETAAVTGATLAASVNFSRMAHAAGGDRIKLALVGCGGRGTGAANDALSARTDVELVAFADLFRDRAKNAAAVLKEKHPDRVTADDDHLFGGVDAYQQAVACGADVIMLATPPGFRPQHYATAIQAGKHVFMEKPVCVDVPGYQLCMQTNELADKKGLKVAVGLQRRHSQFYLDHIARLHDGEVGKLHLLRCYWNGAHASGGYPGDPPKDQELEWQIRNWNHFCWLSGDHIVEQHVHNIDVCNWIMKDQHPVEAMGMGGREVRKKSNMYDHHFVEFTYPEGIKMYSQCRQIAGCADLVAEYAHGDKGMMELRDNGNDGYRREHADLAAAIKDGGRLNDAWHSANSTMTAILGRMATHSGDLVTWEQAVKSTERLGPEKLDLGGKPPITVGEDGLYAVDVPGVYEVS